MGAGRVAAWQFAGVNDQALVISVRGRGLVVITGCGHAGVVNRTRPVQYTRFRIYNSKCGVIKAYLCFTGNHGNFKTSPRYVSNGCIYRVWIYTAQDEHGEGLCINPHRPTSGLKKTYRTFKVVHNQDECPS